ncbi:MAG TPA: homocysteine S-methyltransferase family protein [Anaerolineales bacterium]|nr:homocysteine S-methyltransferase family protein [Anaerolineales bacterium]
MNVKNFLLRVQAGDVFVSDGATGTNLLARGLPRGVPAEAWLFEKPDAILELHREFVSAGADIILTNTFGASPIRLESVEVPQSVKMVNQRAVYLARQAAGEVERDVFVGGSMGPCGQLLKPYGPLTEEQVYQNYLEQAKELVANEVDLIVIETQFDLKEASLAVKAVREISAEIPLVCSFSYDRGVHTMMGVNPTKMAQAFGELRVDVLGINCGHSLEHNFKALQELKAVTHLPIWFKPNAGLPKVDQSGTTYYDLSPEEMGSFVSQWLQAGASVVGGCCGTTPQHLAEIAKAVKTHSE